MCVVLTWAFVTEVSARMHCCEVCVQTGQFAGMTLT